MLMMIFLNIMAFPKEKIVEGDKILLDIARRRLPKFKFDNIDVLIIDRIGKNISGEGADPNVTGRGFMPYFKDDFHTKRLFIRGLTEQSHHNACGLGLADITTRRCLTQLIGKHLDQSFNKYNDRWWEDTNVSK